MFNYTRGRLLSERRRGKEQVLYSPGGGGKKEEEEVTERRSHKGRHGVICVQLATLPMVILHGIGISNENSTSVERSLGA